MFKSLPVIECCNLSITTPFFLSFTVILICFRYEEAANLGRQLLMKNPSLVCVWVCVADLYSHCGEPQATRQVISLTSTLAAGH